MRRFFVFALVLASWSSGVRAQDAADPSATDAEARGLFLAGQAAFTDARYEDALRYFRRAYELSHREGLLYNVAVAADRLRHDAEALEAFEQFLELASEDHPSRRDAQARVRVLRRMRDAETDDPAEEPDAEEPDAAPPELSPLSPSRATSEPAGADTTPAWIVVGAAAAVAIAGGVMLGVGQADADSVTSAADGTPWAEVQDAASRADLLRNLGWVLAGVGLAGLAGGLTWAIVGGSQASDTTATLTIGPGGAQLRGEF